MLSLGPWSRNLASLGIIGASLSEPHINGTHMRNPYILLGRAEASPTQVLSIEIFSLYIYVYMCRAYVLPYILHSNFTNSTKIASGHVAKLSRL